MAIKAIFQPSAGILTEYGDDLDNNLVTSRDAAGNILVNGGAVAIPGGKPTVANTSLIQVFGQGGNDVITLNEANGALPAANLFGGAGNDTMTGGSGGDMLFGQSGNDVLFGKGGNDFIFGGADNDVITGGDGNDQLFGESGDDRFVWNPGDDTDLVEGGAGIDTVEVNGGNGNEVFTTTANGTRVRFDRLDPAPFSLDIGTSESLVLNMNGGDDTFSATGNLAALIKVTVDGGTGNDTILGSNGNDLLMGGDGDDFIDGQQGNDTVFLGAGTDVFQWDPGDGSDTVEGQGGTDTMRFNGSAASEIIDITANGGRARLARNVGSIVMDLNDVERIDINALAGTDVLTVGDLSGTDVVQVDIDLAGTLNGPAGDAAADTVHVDGTQGGDIVDVFGAGTSVAVVGLQAMVSMTAVEGANDTLVVRGQGGNDAINASTLAAGIVKLVVDAGAGNDVVVGSRGDDVILGGDGNDVIDGQQGNDLALMGAGDDVFGWDPGEGSDTVEGQDGFDTLRFNGSNASENIDIFANGGRARLFRDVAAVDMDLDDVERIEVKTLGGADNVVVGDLSGTDVKQVAIDLGAADAQQDSVTVQATQGDDVVGVVEAGGVVKVVGLAAETTIVGAEAGDRLTLNGLAGNDVIDASGLAAGKVTLAINGGLGDDVLVGSAGADVVSGGDGNDFALLGAGNDRFVWNPGDDNDVVEGQAGFDTLQFNGSNITENISITANGGRALFFRDIANVTMDLNDVEEIEYAALGGADNVVVGDLSGTDVERVRINLGNGAGAGDAQPDSVRVTATQGADAIVVSMVGNDLVVDGLAAQVVISNFEAGTDTLVIDGLAGDDVIDASALPAGFGIVALGGDGDDALLGGAAGDVLLGGAGDDVLLGNAGDDVLDGGLGEDVLVGGDGDDVLLNGEIAIQSLAGTGSIGALPAYADALI